MLTLTQTGCDPDVWSADDAMSADQSINRLDGKTFGLTVRQGCILTIAFAQKRYIRTDACVNNAGEVLIQRTEGAFRLSYDRILETPNSYTPCPPPVSVPLGNSPPHFQLTGNDLQITFQSGLTATMTRLMRDPLPAGKRVFGCYATRYAPATFKPLP